MSCKSKIKDVIKHILYRLSSPAAVLMFHSVNESGEEFSIGYDAFQRLITSFEPKAYRSVNELKTDTEHGIYVTFDDAYEDVYTKVYPLLCRLNIPFTVFQTTENIGKAGYLTEEQIREMSQNSLVTIGSHCVHHKPLSGQSKEEQTDEMQSSRKMLETLIHKPVDILAYPYGKNDEITQMVCASVYKLGFDACGGMTNRLLAKNRYRVRRMNVDCLCCEAVSKELKRYFPQKH